jgi:hypothetical protein
VPGHKYDFPALLPLAVGAFCIGELNDQLVRLNFDPDDMSVDEDGILDLGDQVEVSPNRFDDEGFNLVSGDPADGPGLFGSRDSIGIWCLASGHGWGSGEVSQ